LGGAAARSCSADVDTGADAVTYTPARGRSE
jgi:hypothetical protein